MIRTFGKTVNYGGIVSIYPIVLIFATGLAQLATFKLGALVVVIIGTAVMAVSPAFIAIAPTMAMCGLFVAVMSLGFTISGPRMTTYGLNVAPYHKDGTFTALAYVPISISKFPTGLLSGFLLDKYCPKEGAPCNGVPIWLIITAIAVTCPIMVAALYKWLYDENADIQQENVHDDHGHGGHDDHEHGGKHEAVKYVRLDELEHEAAHGHDAHGHDAHGHDAHGHDAKPAAAHGHGHDEHKHH